MHEYWLNDARSLEELSGAISAEFDAKLEGDVENVYEWFSGDSESLGLKFNISRKHIENWHDPSNPVRISISGPSYSELGIDGLGRRLAACLGSRLTYGDVTYLGGDDFRFEQVRGYDPET